MPTLDELTARVMVLEANAAGGSSLLPPRTYTDQEVADLKGAYPGGTDEMYRVTLTYRDVAASATWFDSIFATYSVAPPDLNNLPHNVYQTVTLYAPVAGPWPLSAPVPFPGYVGPTTNPQEILDRAHIGQAWTGDPPCGDAELANRTALLNKVMTNQPGAGADWYECAKDPTGGLEVLICGTGFNPYSHDMQNGDAYPCPGKYTLDEVCAAITGGGQPG